MGSGVRALGTNMADVYSKTLKKKNFASSQGFTNSFNADFFVL